MNHDAVPCQRSREDVTGIAACMLLIMAAFTPIARVELGIGLPALAAAALALLFLKHRWALVFPSVYVTVVLARFLFEKLTAEPQLGFPSGIWVPGMSPWLLLLLLPGTIAGFVACWSDLVSVVKLLRSCPAAGDSDVLEPSEEPALSSTSPLGLGAPRF